MEIVLFYKSGHKNINIDYFKYNQLSNELLTSVEEGINAFHSKIKKFTVEEYNPLAIDKGRKILESLELSITLKDSKLLEIYSKILSNNSVEMLSEDSLKYTYQIQELNSFGESNYPISFYAIIHEDNIYFKKTNDSRHFLKSKTLILTHIEEAQLKKINNNHMLLDTSFDFYLDTKQNEIFIKNAMNFETISSYEIVYEKHRQEILDIIQQQEVIENFEEFKIECNKKFYLRAFKKIPPQIIVKNNLENKTFIEKIIKDTQNQITWNEDNTKILINHNQVKTVIYLLSGLIGVDIYDEIVTFNQKEKIT